MAFNQQNLSSGNAFFRFMLGSVLTTYGTVRLLREPKSRSGKMLVFFGSMKAAEGATKFCPTKAMSTIMENLSNESANQGAQANAGAKTTSGTQFGQNASSGSAGQKSGNIMQMVESIAQKLTSANLTQSTSGSQGMGGNQNSSGAGQSTAGTNAQTISNIAQTVAPQFSSVVKGVAGMTTSQNASGTQKQASGASGTSNKKDSSASSSNTKSASSTNNKQAASPKVNNMPKSDTKPQLDGAANNTNLDPSIIDTASKSGQKNISTPNILQ